MYFPGVQNTAAGFPSMDLFADWLNAHKNEYVSWKPDPQAMTIDNFSLSRSNLEVICISTILPDRDASGKDCEWPSGSNSDSISIAVTNMVSQ